jgi:hypothetical protein
LPEDGSEIAVDPAISRSNEWMRNRRRVGSLSRLFIGHSSADNVSAKAFEQWLGASLHRRAIARSLTGALLRQLTRPVRGVMFP